MSPRDVAGILNDGAIIMGDLFCADGHSKDRHNFAISHMHSDHASLLTKCLYNGRVFMTKATRDLLEAINDDKYATDTLSGSIKRKQVKILEYKERAKVSENDIIEYIAFYHSNHALGASQIEITTKDKKRIVYSGDITKDDIPPENIHTLILDATHGHPSYDRVKDPASIERRMLDKIDEVTSAENPQSVVIHGHEGKIQEVMALISKHKTLDNFPMQASAKEIKIADVYRKYDFNIREEITDWSSDEGEEQREETDWPFIEFYTQNTKRTYENKRKAFTFLLTDKSNQAPIIESDNTWTVTTSAHAGHSELLSYVEKAKTTTSEQLRIIVDNSRSKQAKALVGVLHNRGYNVEFQPKI